MFENEFNGKVALVTGGTSGIGLATVKSFLASGAKVYFLGKEGEDVTAVLEELKASYPSSTTRSLLPITRQLRLFMLRSRKCGEDLIFL